jgi:hypothetical protein
MTTAPYTTPFDVMRRALLLLALLTGCDDGPTAVTVADAQVTVVVERRAGKMTISNSGVSSITFVALDPETLNLVDLQPCESWRALAAGNAAQVPITAGVAEMVVMYCVFPVPPPAKPSGSATLSVPVR